jgi:hypothetical protein
MSVDLHILTGDEICRLLPMADCIDLMEGTMISVSQGSSASHTEAVATADVPSLFDMGWPMVVGCAVPGRSHAAASCSASLNSG